MRAAAMTNRRQLAALRYLAGFQRPWVPERQLVRDGAARVERLLRSWAAAPGWPDSDVAARYRAAMQVDNVAHCSLEYHRWAVRSLPRPDGVRFARRLRSPVRAPVLQLHGELDRAVLPSTATGSGRYVDAPYAWCLLGGVGHVPHEESPAEFTKRLLAWLAQPRSERAGFA
jgi:pimeloyl-ACP methyl ester carboxylesterase